MYAKVFNRHRQEAYARFRNCVTGNPNEPSSSGSSGPDVRRKRVDLNFDRSYAGTLSDDRLRSFGAWPTTAPIAKEKVARAGFYYTGSGLETLCPFCHLEVKDWRFNDICLKKHRDLSPNCPFVKQSQSSTASQNVPFEELMKRADMRLQTFDSWPKPEINVETLVNAGFYYLKVGDQVRCAWCKGVVQEWSPQDSAMSEHARLFPTCQFVLCPHAYGAKSIGGEDVCGKNSTSSGASSASASAASEKSKKTLNGLEQFSNISLHNPPSHTSLASPDARMQTFTNSSWPADAKVSRQALVEAGFFYLGMYDYTKCFHCDGGLCSWEAGDDPWTEHARWFPACHFVKLNKGDAFIRDCQIRHNEMLEEASAAVGGEVQTAGSSQDDLLPPHLRTELDTLMSSDDVAFYLSKDIPSEILRMTLKRYMIEKKRGFSSQNELAQVLGTALSFGRKDPVDSVGGSSAVASQESAKEVPENILCRVCLDRERGVVFLPCGHLVTCPTCAASVTECVLCRTPIAGTVRTFLS